jgi:hypothetical protein
MRYLFMDGMGGDLPFCGAEIAALVGFAFGVGLLSFF